MSELDRFDSTVTTFDSSTMTFDSCIGGQAPAEVLVQGPSIAAGIRPRFPFRRRWTGPQYFPAERAARLVELRAVSLAAAAPLFGAPRLVSDLPLERRRARAIALLLAA